jgi:hypothetical protein
MNWNWHINVTFFGNLIEFLCLEREDDLLGLIYCFSHRKGNVGDFRRCILVELYQNILLLKFLGIPDKIVFGNNLNVNFDYQTTVIFQILVEDTLSLEKFGKKPIFDPCRIVVASKILFCILCS